MGKESVRGLEGLFGRWEGGGVEVEGLDPGWDYCFGFWWHGAFGAFGAFGDGSVDVLIMVLRDEPGSWVWLASGRETLR